MTDHMVSLTALKKHKKLAQGETFKAKRAHARVLIAVGVAELSADAPKSEADAVADVRPVKTRPAPRSKAAAKTEVQIAPKASQEPPVVTPESDANEYAPVETPAAATGKDQDTADGSAA